MEIAVRILLLSYVRSVIYVIYHLLSALVMAVRHVTALNKVVVLLIVISTSS